MTRAAWPAYQGYRVDVAHSGAEGLEQARRRAPDVVILDILMACYQDVRLLWTSRRPILTFMSNLAPRPSPWGTGAWPRNCSS